MGYPLKAKTIEAISLAQEPVNLSIERAEAQEEECARYLLNSKTPHLVLKGMRMLRRLRNRQMCRVLRKLRSLEVGYTLPAERREKFIRQIEIKAHGDE